MTNYKLDDAKKEELVEMLRDSLRLPGDIDAKLLNMYVLSSVQYVLNSINDEQTFDAVVASDLFNFVVVDYATLLYSNRGGVNVPITDNIKSALFQLNSYGY
ncbi:head-tail connector protein [Pediococcus pentosaceus]|uniref:head-tail connector protein n=1 Tax=Pediococcus pentosaceus TaxID=1255 RepID=UPI002073D5E5|nr:head-tail connector protein [Pediococcus pentosaceus]MCQ0029048.1 head-tail connector protein [Pediococcus pentosaceus]